MVVHPGAGHTGGTLVNALLHHIKDLSGIGGELRPGHRPSSGSRHVGIDGGGKERCRAPGAVAPVQRSRGGKGVRGAGVGRRARRAAESTRRSGEIPSDRQKMSTSARRARTCGDARDASRATSTAFHCCSRDRDRPHPSDPRPPQRDRPSDRRRSDVRRRTPANRGTPARRPAARTPIPAFRATGIYSSGRRPARRVRFSPAARFAGSAR